MKTLTTRRQFLAACAQTSAAVGALGAVGVRAAQPAGAPLYKISLAEWSINKPLRKGTIQHLDFAKIAKSLGIDAIEYVNQFFKDKANDKEYLADMNKRAKGEGVKQVLIMCDGEGDLGDPDNAKRQTAVENHYKWVEAAKSSAATRFASTPTAAARPRSRRSSSPMGCTSCACLPIPTAST